MNRLVPITAILVGACTPPIPPDAVPLYTVPQYVAIAERTADIVDAPEHCRDWGKIAVTNVWRAEDFYPYSKSGRCPPSTWDLADSGKCSTSGEAEWTAYAQPQVTPGPYEFSIVFSGDNDAIIVAHEVYHYLSACMFGYGPDLYQNGDGNHEHPNWGLVEETISEDVCNGTIEAYPAPAVPPPIDAPASRSFFYNVCDRPPDYTPSYYRFPAPSYETTLPVCSNLVQEFGLASFQDNNDDGRVDLDDLRVFCQETFGGSPAVGFELAAFQRDYCYTCQ